MVRQNNTNGRKRPYSELTSTQVESEEYNLPKKRHKPLANDDSEEQKVRYEAFRDHDAPRFLDRATQMRELQAEEYRRTNGSFNRVLQLLGEWQLKAAFVFGFKSLLGGSKKEGEQSNRYEYSDLSLAHDSSESKVSAEPFEEQRSQTCTTELADRLYFCQRDLNHSVNENTNEDSELKESKPGPAVFYRLKALLSRSEPERSSVPHVEDNRRNRHTELKSSRR